MEPHSIANNGTVGVSAAEKYRARAAPIGGKKEVGTGGGGGARDKEFRSGDG